MIPTLPNAVDSFRTLRTRRDEYLYIDKTRYVASLALALLRAPQLFFARPRRFGKTLLISTLEALFQGEKHLFEGTWIGQTGRWDWERHRYDVLRLDLGIRGVRVREELEFRLNEKIRRLARKFDVALPQADRPALLLEDLLEALHDQGRRVALLIDEYDTPITENMERPTLGDTLDAMRDLYGALKSGGQFTQCTFMTGITRFARASLFSGANHFRDVTFAGRFNALLGFTDAELDQPAVNEDLAQCARNVDCAPHQLRQALRAQYNGYRFSRINEAVYNPFSVAECLTVLREAVPGEYRDLRQLPKAWAASGTPALLFRLMSSGRYASETASVISSPNPLEYLERNKSDASRPDYAALMYHAGYLTFKENEAGALYLGLPNAEVALSFNENVLQWQRAGMQDLYAKEGRSPWGIDIKQSLLDGDETRTASGIDHFFRRLPGAMLKFPQAVKTVESYEMYYQNMLFSGLQGARIPVRAEEAAAQGLIDIVIEWPVEYGRVTILEFKVVGTPQEALNQVWARGYADLYRTSGKAVTVFGLVFAPEQRSIQAVKAWTLGAYDAHAERWAQEPNPQLSLTALGRIKGKQRRGEIVRSWRYGDASHAE